MAKLFISKEVLHKAKALVAEGKRPEVAATQPLPVVTLWYPVHGKGPDVTQRFVRVYEMDGKRIRGFEIASEFDEEPGKPHTYTLAKIPFELVQLLHLSKTNED
jgi:hypothetical protein